MQRQFLKSKIHRATVTESNQDYEGSITIDGTLMEAANVAPWEKVLVANVTTGARVETYCIPGTRCSGVICMNGGAAHYAKKGDTVIIMSFAVLSEEEVPRHEPRVVKVNAKNKITSTEAIPCPE